MQMSVAQKHGSSAFEDVNSRQCIQQSGRKVFFGMTVRQAYMVPVDVVIVHGSQRIAGADNGAGPEEHEPENEQAEYEQMDEDLEADAARAANSDDLDDDVSDIQVDEQ